MLIVIAMQKKGNAKQTIISLNLC